jgi:hypothetical protein
MATMINLIGNVLLIAALVLILLCYISIGMDKGIWHVLQMLAPWNIMNYLAMGIAVAPGIALKTWARNIKDSQSEKEKS